jgi:hypothetical protein
MNVMEDITYLPDNSKMNSKYPATDELKILANK